ncbi:MAG: NAD(P)-dependent dehydrogenase (short-subunit alcohol dehydrogenase family) [Parvibaculaceae bacterium]|jgi:NAD(P)-dependent dehydrogenase (short-subunit alcohol dehydrogenase family)|nr:SDR family NAD(P)-dependent oxidoreductase [Parvibaculaceae bacterium]
MPTIPTQDLTGRVALVTGTTSGLGRRFALVLAQAGADVVITGRRVERLAPLAAEIEALGRKALPLALDVTDISSIESVVAQTKETFGRIDILINNAGMNVAESSIDMTPEQYDQMSDTNVKGVFFTSTRVAPIMIEQGSGSIINIGSIGTHTVLPGSALYCTTKAAVGMMTKSHAREWARYGVNVNAICPGYIMTELTGDWFGTPGGEKQLKSFPRRRLADEDALDGTMLLLASDQGKMITGSIMTIDDGQSL